MTAPIRFKQRLLKTKSPHPQEDRDVQQIEDYHRQQGMPDDAVESMAESDYDLAQRLNKKRRGLQNVKIGGIEN